jgi:hypothetical protein
MKTKSPTENREINGKLSAPAFHDKVIAEYRIDRWLQYIRHEVAELKAQHERDKATLKELEVKVANCIEASKRNGGNISEVEYRNI